jgi:acylphosphatase
MRVSMLTLGASAVALPVTGKEESVTVRKRLLVSGRVQGVFFRETCRHVAQEKGVAGRARNLSDGRVEIVLEGDPGAVAEVEAWCHHGPDWAEVDSVDVSEEPPEGLIGFSTG